MNLGDTRRNKPYHRSQLTGNDVTETELISRYVSLQLYYCLDLQYRHRIDQTETYLHSILLSTLHQMWFDTSGVLGACSRRHACSCLHSQCGQSHPNDTIIPCGRIVQKSRGSLETVWEIRVPFGLRVNITLLHMTGHAYTRECLVTESLTLTELSEKGAERKEHVVCGRSPIQNFYSTTRQVRVTWFSNTDHESEASFCLMYQAISPSHVILLDKADMKDMRPVEVCRTDPTRNCIYPRRLRLKLCELQNQTCDALRPSALFVHGHTWVYTWSFSGHVLQTPTVEIKSFWCDFKLPLKNTNNAVNRLQVTDGPFFVRDPYFFSGMFAILGIQHCGQLLKQKNFTSSIGDITIQAIWNSWQKFVVKIKFSLLALPCPSLEFCSLEKREISTQEPISIFSTNHSSQTRVLLSLNRKSDGFIELRDMAFHYDGLGHLLCATGGIFIFELEPMSLVTKICTLWTADIWSRSKKTQGVNSLYFNDKPVLIVIKSYKDAGWGYIVGSVQISKYPGFQNFIFRAKSNARYQYDLSQWYIVERQVDVKHLALVNHSASHIILQEAVLDEDESWHSNWKYGIVVSNKLNVNAEMSMVTISGCFDLPSSVSVNLRRKRHHFKPTCLSMRLYSMGKYIHSTPIDPRKPAENRSCFTFDQPFTDFSWSLLIDTVCFLFGLKLTVVVKRIGFSDLDCSSSVLTKQEMLRFTGEMPAFLPSLPCGTMTFLGTQQFRLYLGVLSKPSSRSDCCYMKLWARAYKRLYYLVMESIALTEEYVSDRLDYKLKTYKWIPSQSPSTLRGNISDKNGVFEIHFTGSSTLVAFVFEVEIRPSRRLNYSISVLNLTFHHFFLSETMKPWSYQQQRQRPMKGEIGFCVDVIGTCYKAFLPKKSDWETADNACTAIGMHMLTLNTEIEWKFIRFWYQENLMTLRKLSQTQLFFLGIEFLPVSINMHVVCAKDLLQSCKNASCGYSIMLSL